MNPTNHALPLLLRPHNNCSVNHTVFFSEAREIVNSLAFKIESAQANNTGCKIFVELINMNRLR